MDEEGLQRGGGEGLQRVWMRKGCRGVGGRGCRGCGGEVCELQKGIGVGSK